MVILDLPDKSDFVLLILDPEPDNNIVTNDEVENISDNTSSHMRSRAEFGWQLALQQTSITNRHKQEDLEVI
jgi:hypothetical protein